MQWLYIIGAGLNSFGFIRLSQILGPLDNTSTLVGLKLASIFGGILFFVMGFFYFDWWIPLIGWMVAPLVFFGVLKETAVFEFPQIAIISGLILSAISFL